MTEATAIPKTLLQLAGADLSPPQLSESALVIIDAQNEYVTGLLPLAGIEAALAAAGRLLDAARQAGAVVIHVVHKGGAGGPFDPAGPGFAIAEPVVPVAGERVIEKGLPNSFAGTDLHEVLTQAGRRSLVVAGFMTHMCVSSTVRAGLDLGYRTTIAADAVTTRDLPDPLGGAPLSAADVHRAALAELADRFAVVTTVDAILAQQPSA
ncbi:MULTISPECIES: cysteine hydrolase family protein [unclassified Chelatococcus]|uniref:cysteine hydrolase family protein n=1 Tax=unclassified Chelatococcus TaxID=2638111 RepID=UPI001BCF6968|nr:MULTISPECIES: cysteine hydrolase family protein [unclassified Chelatococcus]CAH1648718.1 Isochorismatase [Hyphomicrobiales bacterium]MBS7739490.1 cysteine hydrolase [Chelatococcus sp. HY11]MBX3543859.1 cysteine hydrolase [Chelatococcus sp.]MCO5075973.1 cysteine hydrolase [Chelatococcus sp.]CAH1668163.1 Isochorismatase [Hyphomicrobiales bacterium]